MRIPEGMTEESVFKVIDKVCTKFDKFKFSIYSAEDIRQEAFILCVEALERYTEGPLENFLSVHVRNRLINLRRNKSDANSDKFLINYPVCIDNVDEECESGMKYHDRAAEKLIGEELMEEINSRVPIERRMDLIKIMHGGKVNKARRMAIIELIGDLFE